MKVAIMQPYLFPYIGYYQLVNAVDKFIFYDDVNFIKRGWINRNNVLVNDSKQLITINLKDASQNKLINDICIEANIPKILKTIRMAYSKAPYFNKVFPVIEKVLNSSQLISEIASNSVKNVAQYLNLNVEFEYSSEVYSDTKGLDKADRLIEICKRNNATTYINAAGGAELYSKEYFRNNGVDLFFINNKIIEYNQFGKEFIPYLSIIDVMMFNSPEKVKILINAFELV